MRENSAQIGVIEPIVIAEVEVRSPVIPVEVSTFVPVLLTNLGNKFHPLGSHDLSVIIDFNHAITLILTIAFTTFRVICEINGYNLISKSINTGAPAFINTVDILFWFFVKVRSTI
jgi:hypothetical protein